MSGELSCQQKIWLALKTIMWALRPLMLYLFMPGICVLAGILIRGPGVSVDRFFKDSGNFYTAAGMVASIGLLYHRSRKKEKSLWREAGIFLEYLDRRKAAGCIGFGMAASVSLSAALTLLPLPKTLILKYQEASAGSYGGTDFLFLLFTLLCMAPVLEEIIFRGLMYRRLRAYFTAREAAVIVAVFFSACHGNLLWMCYAFLMSLILTGIAVRENNTGYGIFLHAGFNFPSVVTFVITSHPPVARLFYKSPILIGLYGVLGAAAMFVLWKRYEKDCGV